MREMSESLRERYRVRVAKSFGALYGVRRAMKRYRCDGHMASERHWIEQGALYVVSALPPDDPEIGNVGWWHARFCADCAPAEYARATSESGAVSDALVAWAVCLFTLCFVLVLGACEVWPR